jgi:phosphoglycerate dehydrogenase-like enzyme
MKAWPGFVDLAMDKFTKERPNISVTAGPSTKKCDLLVAAGSKEFNGSVLERTSPETLVLPHAGIPLIFRQLLVKEEFSGIKLYNLHHNAHATAELGITLLLTASRRLNIADQQMKAGRWLGRTGHAPSAPELGGILQSDQGTVLVMGYGNIGKRVAQVCKALGMRVMATCRSPAAADLNAVPGVEIYSNSDLHSLLPQCSAVVVALPLTDETRGLLGRKELALMLTDGVSDVTTSRPADDAHHGGSSKRCCLVNVGRAEVVEEDALWEALQVEGGTRLAFGADVWWSEASTGATVPFHPSERFPFHSLDNVVMTPHYAGGKGLNGIEAARVAALLRVVDEVAAGGEATKPVDVRAGY